MKSHVSITAALLVTLTGAAQPPAARPPDPTAQPLLRRDQIAFVGSFTLPVRSANSGPEPDMAWGGYAVGMGPDGRSLFVGCHDWGDRLARVTIPDVGGEATVVEPCVEVPNVTAISGPQGLTNGLVLGGSLWWNGRLVVSAYTYYDSAAGTSGGHNKTHFAGGPGVADLKGPWRVGGAGRVSAPGGSGHPVGARVPAAGLRRRPRARRLVHRAVARRARRATELRRRGRRRERRRPVAVLQLHLRGVDRPRVDSAARRSGADPRAVRDRAQPAGDQPG